MISFDDMPHGISLPLYFGLFSLLFFISIFTMSNTVFATSQHTGVILPLYIHPDDEWQKVIQAKNDHPSVPMLGIINPNNGPGSCPNEDCVKGITNLKS
jgi:spherulation-specific family 4 protein